MKLLNPSFLAFYLFFGFLLITTRSQSNNCNSCSNCKQCPTCSTTTQCPTTTRCPTTTEWQTTTQSPPASTCSCPTTVIAEATDCRNCPTFSASPSDSKTTIQKCPNLGNQDVSPGIIVGAIVGGTLLGSITSIIIFVVFCRKLSSSNGCKKCNTTFFDGVKNPTYQYEDNTTSKASQISSQTNTAYCEIIDGLPKTARITPIQKTEESTTKDDVYNHLHSSEEMDRSDYYDHAGPAPSLSFIDDGYGVMSSSGSESNGAYSQVNGKITHSDYEIAGNKQNDEYFTLEVKTDGD